MCSDRRKNHGCGQKNQKALTLLYLASKPLRNAVNSSVCRPSSQQNRQDKFEFSPELYRLIFFALIELFAFHQKDNWVFLWAFFSINKFVFDFCCFCLFCYNTGHHAISRQKTRDSAHGYIQCKAIHIGDPWSGRMDRRTDGQSRDYYVTTKISWLDRLPNLAMVLRWRASVRALLRNTWCDVKIQVCSFKGDFERNFHSPISRVMLCLRGKKNVRNFKYSLHWVPVVFLARLEKSLWECSRLLRRRRANFWILLIRFSFIT